MNHPRIITFLTLATLALGLPAASALAQDSASKPAAQTTAGAQAPNPAMQQRRMRMQRMRSTGRHLMVGKVTSLDAKTGMISVDAEGKLLTLHFPSEALAGLAKGDTVTVFLALRKGDVKAMRERMMQQRQAAPAPSQKK